LGKILISIEFKRNCLRIGQNKFIARAWLIESEGALLHILYRVNENPDIGITDDDRKLFLAA